MDARLEAASRAGDLDAFHRLLQEDSLLLHRVNTTNYLANNPLHVAALLGHSEFAREILNLRPELAGDLNEQGLSALHLASANGHLSVVKELLKVSSGLCLVPDKDGFLPIHTAVIKGRDHIMRELIEACPEAARVATCQQHTVLHLAVMSNCFDVVEFLVEKMDGDELLNSKDEKGNNILHVAVARKQLQIIRFLLRNSRIEINSINLKEFTPLDVLLESPREQGDLAIGEMIRAANGKTAAECLAQSPARSEPNPTVHSNIPPRRRLNQVGRCWHRFKYLFKFAHGSKTIANLQAEKENTSGILMVVATLIATITFQAGLNPPGGFVPDDEYDNSANSIQKNNQFKIGQVILQDKLIYFLVFDMLGLFASLSIILLLICVVPRKKRKLMKFLVWVMWLAVFFTALAFICALAVIYPKSSTILDVFDIFWIAVLDITLICVCIRFIIYLLKKGGWLRKRRRTRENNVEGGNRENNVEGVTAIKRIGSLIMVIAILVALAIVHSLIFYRINISS